jgi:septum formation protein
VIVLASASPRRTEILRTLGIEHAVVPSDADEAVRAEEAPVELAQRLARTKALAVSRQCDAIPDPSYVPNDLPRWGAHVIGADTIVVEGGVVLNKPADDNDARAMIARIAGGWHEVVTAVALVQHGSVLGELAVTTRVRVAPLTSVQIDAYVATGEGRDKAGAYAVQGLFAGAIERIEGSYSNVVGLPARETVALLVEHGAIERWP